MSDTLYRFHFRTAPVRGHWVALQQTWADVCRTRTYDSDVKNALGEMLAVVAMISHNINFEGAVALQSSGDGPLSMALAECSERKYLRGLANETGTRDFAAAAATGSSFRELIGSGRLALSLLPTNGETYQGIVQLVEPSLSRNIENYFAVSEQLVTRLRLSVQGDRVVGCLLQRLPDADLANELQIHDNEEQWRRVVAVFDTLSDRQLTTLSVQKLLRALFKRDLIQLDNGHPMEFRCPCSISRTENALRTMAAAELEAILSEEGAVRVTCEFCGAPYSFGARAVHRIINGEDAPLH